MNKFIGPALMLLYYTILIYLFLGFNIILIGMVLILALFVSALGYLFLDHPLIKQNDYEEKDILLYVSIVQIILVTLFIGFIIAYGSLIEKPISPLTGHILFIASIIVQGIFLFPSYKLKWVQYAAVIYLIVYFLFAIYYMIPYGILLLLFGYVIIQNIVVISYGLLKYKEHFKIIRNEG